MAKNIERKMEKWPGLCFREQQILDRLELFAKGKEGKGVTYYNYLERAFDGSHSTIRRALQKMQDLGYLKYEVCKEKILYTIEQQIERIERIEQQIERIEPLEQKIEQIERIEPIEQGERVSGQDEQTGVQNERVSGQNERNLKEKKQKKINNKKIELKGEEKEKVNPKPDEIFEIAKFLAAKEQDKATTMNILYKICMCEAGYLNPKQYVDAFYNYIDKQHGEDKTVEEKMKAFSWYMTMEPKHGKQPEIGEEARLWLAHLLDKMEQKWMPNFCNRLLGIHAETTEDGRKRVVMQFEKEVMPHIVKWIEGQNLPDKMDGLGYDMTLMGVAA